MANVGTRATNKLIQFLKTPAGLSENLAAVAELEGAVLAPITDRQILVQHVAQEFVERALDLRYPTLLVYCEKFTNDLREKFRTFSGRAQMVIEVRMSQDRIEGLEKLLEIYVDTV